MYANAASIFQNNEIEMIAFSTGKSLGNFAYKFNENKIKTIHFPIDPGLKISYRSIDTYKRFYSYLKNEKIDVLHIHRNDLYMVALCARIAKVKTIKTMHSVFKNRKHTYPYGVFKRWFARKFLRVKFQTIGQSVFENELKYYHNPSVMINNWYHNSRFYPPQNFNEKKELRRMMGLEEKSLIIISVGGCSEIKNHADIIRAISTLKNRLDLIYLHLGAGDEEENERKLAKELGVDNEIKFLGNQSNVQDFLRASDVFVMPSKFEGLGISCLEAMACGLPAILYNSPGLRDLINNDDNGFLIEHNYKLLAEKIELLLKNQSINSIKGRNAIEFVNKHFLMIDNVNKIISLYKK